MVKLNNMKILSIYPYLTISSAALLINGKIVSASCEERFNRNKMSTAFPINAINWCLKNNNLSFEDLDLITVPWNPQRNINDASYRWSSDMRWRGEMITNIPLYLSRMMNTNPSNEFFQSFYKNKVKISYYDHHLCHAAFGYYNSKFSNADILVIDGRGEEDTCFTGYVSNNKFVKTGSVAYPHSIGIFYSSITNFLGFNPGTDEWKVMSLASYSKSTNRYDKLLEDLIYLTPEGFEVNLSYFDYYNFDRKKFLFNKKLLNLLGPNRKLNEKINSKHIQIAGALQRLFEKAMYHMVRITKKRGKFSNLIVSGGAAMNSVFNGKLDKYNMYKDTHISFAPDDSGVTIGAAYYGYYKNKKIKNKTEVTDNFYGPSYSDDNVKKILDNFKIKYKKSKNIYLETAKHLSEGKIIGWFQDKMEFGQRALGNRSILCDPRKKNFQDKVNKAVKFRESFRPFAPAILHEKANDVFEKPKQRNIYFMERVYKIKKKWHKIIPAVTHIDGTGRLQTVNKDIHKKFYNLIKEFYKITDVPVLLNTSFNLNGEPVVMKPEDAIKTFYSCGLDILVIGNYIIKK